MRAAALLLATLAVGAAQAAPKEPPGPPRNINACKKDQGVVLTDAICGEGELMELDEALPQAQPPGARRAAPIELPPMGSGTSNFCTDPVYGEILRRSAQVREWVATRFAADGTVPARLDPVLAERLPFETPTQPPLAVTLRRYGADRARVALELGVEGPPGSSGRLLWSAPAGPALAWSCTSTLPGNYLRGDCSCP